MCMPTLKKGATYLAACIVSSEEVAVSSLYIAQGGRKLKNQCGENSCLNLYLGLKNLQLSAGPTVMSFGKANNGELRENNRKAGFLDETQFQNM